MDASGRRMGEGRAPGIHSSNIIERMAVEYGDVKEGVEGEQEYVRMLLGFGFERCMDYAFAGHICPSCGVRSKGIIRASLDAWRGEPIPLGSDESGMHHWYMREVVELQRELILNGVAGTPDGVNTLLRCTESYKLTWMNQIKFEDPILRQKHFWRWEIQEMIYLKMLSEAEGVPYLEAMYFIGWVGGDYKFLPGHGPQIVPYRVEYTQEELDMNWRKVLRYRDLLVSEGAQWAS